MSNRFCVVTATAFFVLLNSSSPAHADVTFELYGGNISCAKWLSNHTDEQEGIFWILGYWTARNQLNSDNHFVGTDTDTYGIIGEVKKICKEESSTILAEATGRAYDYLQSRAANH
jgi:hypothetical protein